MPDMIIEISMREYDVRIELELFFILTLVLF